MAVLKSDLVQVVADKAGLSKKDAAKALQVVLDTVVATVAAGDEVLLTGFGKFRRVMLDQKQGIDPRTQKPLTIPAHPAPRFKAGKAFRDAVKKK